VGESGSFNYIQSDNDFTCYSIQVRYHKDLEFDLKRAEDKTK